MSRIKITLICLFLTSNCLAQVYENKGLKLGLVYEIGQPMHRLGCTFGFHVNRGIFQLSSNSTVFYAFRNYGPKITRWEVQVGGNIGIGFGSLQSSIETTALLTPVSNYTGRKNLAGYGVKYYYDKIGTKQLTGSISIRINDYFFATENDGFVFLPFDKFRTGAISLGRYFFNHNEGLAFSQQKVSMDILIYTGQTQGAPTEKIKDGTYPSRFGYKKLNNSKHSKSSHGIIKFYWTTNLRYNQNAFVDIGLDHERIRNSVQNKIIHDLPFIPKWFIKIKNPHIPMRNAEDKDYLYGENEKIRKGKFVWGVGLNRPFFY